MKREEIHLLSFGLMSPTFDIHLQHGQQLYRHIYLGCKEESSGQQHYETLYALLGLLSVELANEEVVVDLIRLALALQVSMNMALNKNKKHCESS